MTLGVRIVPAQAIHRLLVSKDKGYRPSLSDIVSSSDVPARYGWPLETFVADEFLGCKEGGRFKTIGDDTIQALFYRRSGPIAAAIAITIEAPTGG